MATTHKRGEKPKDEKPVEHLCGNCRNFEHRQTGKSYSNGAGICSAVNQPMFFTRERGLPIQGSIQIFSYFHCSNRNFIPKLQ